MGVFDKFLDIMKLNDDDYDDDFYDEEDEYFDDEEFDEKPARRSLFGKKNTKEESF
ncbi:MAG: cell division protein SepF, partial [[Ruminococcus] torques]